MTAAFSPQARRDLAVTRLDANLSAAVERYLERVPAHLVDVTRRDLLAAPPLSDSTRAKLASLLRGGEQV